MNSIKTKYSCIDMNDLFDLLEKILDISEGHYDPYASLQDRVIMIHDLCAEMLGKKTWR